jgi:hypothetical protein
VGSHLHRHEMVAKISRRNKPCLLGLVVAKPELQLLFYGRSLSSILVKVVDGLIYRSFAYDVPVISVMCALT